MPFPSDPAGQTPANTFSPTSTPDDNTLNNATYTYNATDNQWSTRDPVPPQPAPPPAGTIATQISLLQMVLVLQDQQLVASATLQEE